MHGVLLRKTPHLKTPLAFLSDGSDGDCPPVANFLFAPSGPPTPPVGGIHAALSSYSFGGGFVSIPLKQAMHGVLLHKTPHLKTPLAFLSDGSDGDCPPVANFLFAPSGPPPPPAGRIHAPSSSLPVGGGSGSNPLKQLCHGVLLRKTPTKKVWRMPNFF